MDTVLYGCQVAGLGGASVVSNSLRYRFGVTSSQLSIVKTRRKWPGMVTWPYGGQCHTRVSVAYRCVCTRAFAPLNS